MKKQLIFTTTYFFGIATIILGLLISLGPVFLFKVCPPHEGNFSLCHWSAQAEIGMGIWVAALAFCYITFTDPKTQFGFAVSLFLTGIIVLGIPHALIGGCKSAIVDGKETMDCVRVAFPALTVEAIILMAYSAFTAVYIGIKNAVIS